MIDYHTDDHLQIKGTLVEIVIDTIRMMQEIYMTLYKDNPELAYDYKRDVTHMLETAFVTDEELHEKAQNALKETKERLSQIMSKMEELMREDDDDKDINSADNSDNGDYLTDEELKKFEEWLHSTDSDD